MNGDTPQALASVKVQELGLVQALDKARAAHGPDDERTIQVCALLATLVELPGLLVSCIMRRTATSHKSHAYRRHCGLAVQ